MLTIKIYNKKDLRTENFMRSIENIKNLISKKLNFKNTKIASDSTLIEIGSEKKNIAIDDDTIRAELIFTKEIKISRDHFDNDKEELDRFLNEIRFFCEQVKKNEDLKYINIQYRK
jgi:hypothetical protein